ncbi:hypothetical protein ASD15_20650 [Massilia sp. Root351]|uniref:class I SAM-dependent methyltransferase n=1 Tax=Massilia sp. Root351 TaxID=1736522 RepID=UPI00070A87CB|nr:class I SAM-dependent methyltransferase [Massilia sp. Root351]KQV79076.1 hypothetical protein ASD15_20650 [Massilia sp. Root351]
METESSSTPYQDFARVQMLPFVPQQARRVLDVGCHMGGFGRALKARGQTEVWGVEPNPDTASVAARSLDRVLTGLFSAELALPDHYFDAVVFNDVLEHMPDPWAALKLAAGKLAPQGSIVASIPNLRHIDNLLHIVRDRDFNYEATGIRDRTHLRFYTRKSLPRLFEESGLEILALEGINEDWWTPSLPRRLAFRVFKSFLADTRHIQYAVVARPISGA